MKQIILSIVFLLSGLGLFAQTPVDSKNKSLKYNEFARFYACLDQDSGSSIKYIDTNKVWLKHKTKFSRFWDSATIARINPITEFAKRDMKILGDSVRNLFYPFSGPDFLHANMFFPNAQKMVLLGLERVGKVPDIKDLTDKKLDVFLKAVRQSLDSIFIWGYFMTNDMSKDFARSLELKGVVPVIMLTMARTGYIIENVKKITIDAKGEPVDYIKGRKDLDNPADTYISGVEIKYRKPGESFERTLYYFSHNASEENLKRTPEFMKFLSKQNFDATYLKAASYLCCYLNSIRKQALKSKYVLQDDSGILLENFNEKEWNRYFWGNYIRPIGAFSWAKQPKLREIYKKGENVKPLPFDIGYGSRIGAGNLMLFIRK